MYIYIIARYTCGGTFAAIVHWPTMISYFIYVLYLFFMYICFNHKYWILVILNIFCYNVFEVVKEIHKFQSQSTEQVAKHKIIVITTQLQLKERSISGFIQSWRSRSWIRQKHSGFMSSQLIHYCTQPVWEISLHLNVEFSVFWSLISFQKAPWYF